MVTLPVPALIRRHRAWLTIAAVALFLRLVWVVIVPVYPVSDGAMYHLFAQSIAGGAGYAFPSGQLTAYWPVGPSALYAVAYKIVGPTRTAILLVNGALGVGLALLTFLLARRRFGPRVGWVAGLIAACWPVLIEFTTALNSEVPCAFFLVLGLWIRSWQRPGPVLRTAIATAAFVLAGYMRPIVLPLIPILPLIQFFRHRQLRRTLLELLAALLVTIAMIGPWAMRNQALFGQIVPISTNFGTNLWMGNSDGSTGDYRELPETGEMSETQRDEFFKLLATDWIADHPVDYVKLSLRRFYSSFNRETIGVAWNAGGLRPRLHTPVKLASTLYWWLMGLLAAGGVAFLVRERGLRGAFDPLLVTTGVLLASAVLIVGGDRYHVTADPLLAILAALAIDRLLVLAEPLRHKRR